MIDECCASSTMITVKNKKTGEIKNIEILELFDLEYGNNDNNIIIEEMFNAEIKNISDWEILTPTGFEDFTGIKKITLPKSIELKIRTTSGEIKKFKCSENHKLKLFDNTFEYAINLDKGIVLCDNHLILSKIEIDEEINLYDLLDTGKNNEYITDDIVSHNCAFIPKADEIWGAAQQTLSTGGQAILLSTPAGIGNFFHQKWTEAEEYPERINPIKLHWNLHPEKDQKWRDEQTDLLGPKMASQECDCLSGISKVTVQDRTTNRIKEITLKELYDELGKIEMRMW